MPSGLYKLTLALAQDMLLSCYIYYIYSVVNINKYYMSKILNETSEIKLTLQFFTMEGKKSNQSFLRSFKKWRINI